LRFVVGGVRERLEISELLIELLFLAFRRRRRRREAARANVSQPDHDAALDLLADLGADLEARDKGGDTVIMAYACNALLPSLQRLAGYGASVDMRNEDGLTPLMFACNDQVQHDRKEVLFELLLRAVDKKGYSAIDMLVDSVPPPFEPWQEHVTMELLRSGASVRPHHARRVLPLAVALMQRQEDELAWFESGKQWDWRGHDEVVGLVFDLQYASEDEALVARRREQVRELEEQAAEQERRRRRGRGRRQRRRCGRVSGEPRGLDAHTHARTHAHTHTHTHPTITRAPTTAVKGTPPPNKRTHRARARHHTKSRFSTPHAQMAPTRDSYVVFGAGGPTGYETVKALAADPDFRNATIVAAVRDPLKYVDKFAPLAAEGKGARVETVAADVTDKATVEAAINNSTQNKDGGQLKCKGVVFAASGTTYWSAKSVDHEGVKNVAEAAAASAPSPPRVVLVSSMLTHPENRWHPIRLLLNSIRWSLMDEKFKGEEALRSTAGLAGNWCVIRPGGLVNAPAGSRGLVIADKDVKKEVGTGSLPRSDVAAACVKALKDDRAKGHTFSIYARRVKKGDPQPEPVDPSTPAYGQMIAKLFD